MHAETRASIAAQGRRVRVLSTEASIARHRNGLIIRAGTKKNIANAGTIKPVVAGFRKM